MTPGAVSKMPVHGKQVQELFHSTIVWDHHSCMPLRADASFLPQLERYRKIGVDVVSLNVGFANMPGPSTSAFSPSCGTGSPFGRGFAQERLHGASGSGCARREQSPRCGAGVASSAGLWGGVLARPALAFNGFGTSPAGFEPTAPGLGILCSILLSYGDSGTAAWVASTATGDCHGSLRRHARNGCRACLLAWR
jgi:hypothetical protein